MKNLIQWKPLSEAGRIVEESMFPSFAKLGVDLAVDLYEEKGSVFAKMALPGIAKHDLEVTIEGDMLTITGSRQEEVETEEKDYYSKEIRRGSFSRSVSLPSLVDAERATAVYEQGVLTVAMPEIPGSRKEVVRVNVA